MLAEILTTITAVGAAVMGGVFLAFSVMVMPALRRRPAADAIGVMQQINVAAVRPLFLAVLFGTAAASVALIVGQILDPAADAAQRLVGSALYLASVAVTIGFHVPRNNALARLDPNAAESDAAWTTFAAQWTAGNHVRALLGVAAAVTLLL
ncbi:DUF1772 domain-containing protein [Cryobacterium melibiosiphilum]|uniref:DUF1772 domain-containing protein n=1 Tax=Cryobacterium melibiosiphilum TaxID=995039 RepID=A0A3A5MV79_9MICO|nr:anthrone oxygenase family protein [Cryobacterium melibiosiphilum]RJT89104.1 DUF1772 domain-containing protein [Cryobacterium melibiosiphilum]